MFNRWDYGNFFSYFKKTFFFFAKFYGGHILIPATYLWGGG